jgi:hypothetical protein
MSWNGIGMDLRITIWQKAFYSLSTILSRVVYGDEIENNVYKMSKDKT